MGYNMIQRGGERMDETFVASRLAKLREQKGVSAREMSLSIGQNAGYINNIETGKALPSLPVLFYICDYLEITPAAFFDAGTPCPQKLLTILQDMKKLNDTQLDILATLVEDLARK